jgi:hypothetical protein
LGLPPHHHPISHLIRGYFNNDDVTVLLLLGVSFMSYNNIARKPFYNICTEAEFLDIIGIKVLSVFLLAIHSHLY